MNHILTFPAQPGQPAPGYPATANHTGQLISLSKTRTRQAVHQVCTLMAEYRQLHLNALGKPSKWVIEVGHPQDVHYRNEISRQVALIPEDKPQGPIVDMARELRTVCLKHG